MANLISCRLCSEQRKFCLNSLFEKETEEMLRDLIALKIARSDKIPSMICSNCRDDLKVAYQIQQRMLAAESKYHNEMVTDFLIEHHDELMKIIQDEHCKIQEVKELDESTNSTLELTSSPNSGGENTPVKHKCQICFDKFQYSPDYVKHLQKHIADNKPTAQKTPPGQILCEHCGDILNDSALYDVHINQKHQKLSLHECHYCSEKFPTTMMLEEHVKQLHTDKKPFICDVCNTRFALRYILSLHKAQHSVVKPFACQVCGQTFKQSLSLKAHQTIKHRKEGGADARPTK